MAFILFSLYVYLYVCLFVYVFIHIYAFIYLLLVRLLVLFVYQSINGCNKQCGFFKTSIYERKATPFGTPPPHRFVGS